MTRLLLLIIAIIVYGSLYPWHFDFGRHADPFQVLLHSWPRGFDRFLLRDAAINVALYVPLGVAAFAAFARRLPGGLAFAAALLLGDALSTAMELLQVYAPPRQTSLLDVCSNAIGTLGGALASLAFRLAILNWKVRRPEVAAGAPALLLGLWAGYYLYPFFPLFSRTRLRAHFHLLLHLSAPPVEIWAVWANAAEWFAAALAILALTGRVRSVWLLAALAAVPLRLLIAQRSLTRAELLGVGLGLLLWIIVPNKSRLQAAILMMASAIVLRELAPFNFSARPSPFWWIPFSATLESERPAAVIIIMRKAFDYGGMIWLLRFDGLSYGVAGAMMAAALAGLEFLQRYQPGRTPEITDSLLALLMALVLWLVSNMTTRETHTRGPGYDE